MSYDTDLAYAAGFIDGEGTISIWRQKRPRNKSGKRYRPVLEVYNSDLQACNWFKESFGGYVAQKSKAEESKKAVYKWAANSRDVFDLLFRLETFLRLKKTQAQFVMAFASLLPRPGKRTEALHPLFEGLCNSVQALNKRGLVAKEN